MVVQEVTEQSRGGLVLSFTPRTRIDSFIQSLSHVLPMASSPHTGPERRSEPRFTVATEVAVQPLNGSLRAEGGAFPAVTRNISMGGIALLVKQLLRSPFAAVDFTSDNGLDATQLLVKVSRCEPIGEYYDIGGSFVEALPRS